MTNGLLLDTHTLLWLEAGAPLLGAALDELDSASHQRRVFVSHITLWEIGVALRKVNVERRPHLQGLSVDRWFTATTRRFGLRSLEIDRRIALESAEVPALYESGDPGDCFLIATTHTRRLTLMTRDQKIVQLAERHPDYLSVLPC